LKPPILFRDLIPSFDNGNPRPPACFQDEVLVSETKGLGIPLSKVGFPIRKSADQSFFAAPHGLSQRSTSFIASQRQGIHQMPLIHLIALIINAHPTRQRIPGGRPSKTCVLVERTHGWTLIRKTSLSSDRSDGVRSSSRHKAALSSLRLATQVASDARRLRAARHDSPCGPSSRSALGAILPLHDVRYRACEMSHPARLA
jgi:hypothetical protein